MNKNKVIISVIFLIIDQITKSLVQLYDVNINVINHFFRINYTQNTGAAWSILQGKQTLLIVISLVMLVLVFNMMYSYEENKLNNTAFGLLIGGILGNLVDRIFYGFVRDFFEFNIFNYNFPIFNVADIAIVMGVILVLISTMKGCKPNGNKGK